MHACDLSFFTAFSITLGSLVVPRLLSPQIYTERSLSFLPACILDSKLLMNSTYWTLLYYCYLMLPLLMPVWSEWQRDQGRQMHEPGSKELKSIRFQWASSSSRTAHSQTGRNGRPSGLLTADPQATAVKEERKIWKTRPGLEIAPQLEWRWRLDRAGCGARFGVNNSILGKDGASS